MSTTIKQLPAEQLESLTAGQLMSSFRAGAGSACLTAVITERRKLVTAAVNTAHRGPEKVT